MKIESFAIYANKDTFNERVITTFSIKNDDMNKTSAIEQSDILEMLQVIADGGTISATSFSTINSNEQDEEFDIAQMQKRMNKFLYLGGL